MPQTLPSLRLAVDETAIQRYARITGDYNPIHVDPGFAAQTEMGGVIAHGTMSLNLIWQMLEKALGRQALPSLELDIRFRRPVRPGDMLEAGGAWDETAGAWRVRVSNQAGDAVIEGLANRISPD